MGALIVSGEAEERCDYGFKQNREMEIGTGSVHGTGNDKVRQYHFTSEMYRRDRG